MTRLGGWCMDGHCDDCRYPSCPHHCHTHAAEMVAQTFDRDHQDVCQDSCPHTPHDGFVCPGGHGTIGTAPNEGATSARSLTNPSPESAKTRGERMAENKHKPVLS